ncbi:hypothetical protein AAC387_Pa03g3422 [Persea americana]
MQESESSPHEDPKPEFDEVPRFEKSLQELRDLRSQLNYAADYCEVAFLKAEKKQMVLESTKEYICKAMITVIDHLGNVSANLECLIDSPDEFSQTELRMDGLQHRLLTCKEFTCELDLAHVRWNSAFSRYHPRYSSKLIQPAERSNGAMLMRDSTDLFVAESMYKCKDSPDEKVPSNKKTTTHLTPVIGMLSEFEFSPVFNGPSILSKPRASSFGSQTKDSPRLRFSYLTDDKNKKSMQSSNFLSFLRRSKRAK